MDQVLLWQWQHSQHWRLNRQLRRNLLWWRRKRVRSIPISSQATQWSKLPVGGPSPPQMATQWPRQGSPQASFASGSQTQDPSLRRHHLRPQYRLYLESLHRCCRCRLSQREISGRPHATSSVGKQVEEVLRTTTTTSRSWCSVRLRAERAPSHRHLESALGAMEQTQLVQVLEVGACPAIPS